MNKLRLMIWFGRGCLLAAVILSWTPLIKFDYTGAMVITLLVTGVFCLLHVRAKLGMFENVEMMNKFLIEERADRLRKYQQTPKMPCQVCGQKFDKHRVVRDEVICPTELKIV